MCIEEDGKGSCAPSEMLEDGRGES